MPDQEKNTRDRNIHPDDFKWFPKVSQSTNGKREVDGQIWNRHQNRLRAAKWKLERFWNTSDVAHAIQQKRQEPLICQIWACHLLRGLGWIGPHDWCSCYRLANQSRPLMTFGSEFNLITGHPQDHHRPLANGFSSNKVQFPQNFIDALVAYANPAPSTISNLDWVWLFSLTKVYTSTSAFKNWHQCCVINVTTTCELHNRQRYWS